MPASGMPSRPKSSDLLSAHSKENNGNGIRLQERSPHPYHRRKERPVRKLGQPHLPSPALTPYHSDGEDGGNKYGTYTPRRLALSRTPSESGSDPEVEGLGFVKALPPTSPKPRKGLKTGEDETIEPLEALATPLNDLHVQKQAEAGYFGPASNVLAKAGDSDEIQKAKARYQRRRNSELMRRVAEITMLLLVGCGVINNDTVRRAALYSYGELGAYLRIFQVLCVGYLIRVVFSAISISSWKKIRIRSVRVPSSFDPAPLLYPAFLPVLVSLSLAPTFPATLRPNIILAISALPPQLVSTWKTGHCYHLHWFLSLLPFIEAERMQWLFGKNFFSILGSFDWLGYQYNDLPLYSEPGQPHLSTSLETGKLSREDLALLFPLQQCLLHPLYYLTTTSLLPSELQLSAICLINILLLSRSPQAIILGSIIWIGGLGLFIFCSKALRWNVALERIPRWRFQRAARVVKASTIFISTLTEGLRSQQEASAAHAIQEENSSNQRRDDRLSRQFTNGTPIRSRSSELLPRRTKANLASPMDLTNGTLSKSDNAQSIHSAGSNTKRRSTITSSDIPPLQDFGQDQPFRKSLRSMSSTVQAYLSMTPTQAMKRKWLYALYTYFVVITLIIYPIRIYIQKYALDGQEPLGWAIGYLFSNLVEVRQIVITYDLTGWIPFSIHHSSITPDSTQFYGLLSRLPSTLLVPSNIRLTIVLYWLVVVFVGIAVVIHLSVLVEVDTRRKVFHGMMVAILLPTTFIDPPFLALGLSIVLAVFLLLDLFRAAQLRPLSQPLARFLTPYVDGRDLRGPVVISHMFLLIGCAIPLWLSLAGTKHLGASPWRDWEVATRDVSMVAGVVCVGMGDAAASLVGRRFGRHKWPWLGGKSLEGSAAFAGAVSVGLLFAKVWLQLGQWEDAHGRVVNLKGWVQVMLKAVLAASGASFTEAVLTGANDNVVVPIVLWLLVRGLQL